MVNNKPFQLWVHNKFRNEIAAFTFTNMHSLITVTALFLMSSTARSTPVHRYVYLTDALAVRSKGEV